MHTAAAQTVAGVQPRGSRGSVPPQRRCSRAAPSTAARNKIITMNALYWNFACHQSGYPDASSRSASNGNAARVSGEASGRNPSGTSSPSIVRTFTPGVTSTCSACQGCVRMPMAALPAVRPNWP